MVSAKFSCSVNLIDYLGFALDVSLAAMVNAFT
jgi:hypothetical protein